MTNIYSVANYILSKKGEMTTIKLQKLCYYCKAWSLVWDGTPLFKEKFEAWANGPVCKELFRIHKDKFIVSKKFLVKNNKLKPLTKDEIDTIDAVLKAYGNKDGFFLMQLTNIEKPWLLARGKTEPGASCNKIIDESVMQEYYGGLCVNE